MYICISESQAESLQAQVSADPGDLHFPVGGAGFRPLGDSPCDTSNCLKS